MKWLLFDFSYLAHRAMYAVGGLSYEDMSTGVVYGFFEQLLNVCKVFRSNQIFIAMDSRKSFRRRQFPGYKRRREELKEEEREKRRVMFQQMGLIRREILPEMGVVPFRQVGLESDDLLGRAAKTLEQGGQSAIIVTSDGDLYQCITQAVSWTDPQRRVVHTPETFLEKKGIAASRWGEVKALAGCASDEVPGIPGIGEKSAIAYLLGKLPEHHKRFKSIESEEGRRIRERNRALVTLPHAKTRSLQIVKPKYNPPGFFRAAESLGFDSYLNARREEWERFFSGEFNVAERRRRRHGKVRKRKRL